MNILGEVMSRLANKSAGAGITLAVLAQVFGLRCG
jgi:hypothetical protein